MNAEILFNKRIHIVGIKGTGCCALVELLLKNQCKITGSDEPGYYHTCSVLDSLSIKYYESFSSQNISKNLDFVIHSVAYGKENVELAQADLLNIPTLSYPEALGLISKNSFSIAIAGVHGKTTTAALCAFIAQHLNQFYNLGVTVITGTSLQFLNNQATLTAPGDYFIAETCEYRRNFLNFHPDIIILTSIELDHHDYFTSLSDIRDAFFQFCQKLPQKGTIIFSQDDPQVEQLITELQVHRQDLHLIPYGESAKKSDWHILHNSISVSSDSQKTQPLQQFFLKKINTPISLSIPGKHNIKNLTATLALFSLLMKKHLPSLPENSWLPELIKKLPDFSNITRRSQIIGNINNILIIDDYAHHPTAIQTTLSGFLDFYKPQRLIVSFMSHTYSRTKACLIQFVQSLSSVDILFLHKIFTSAREIIDPSFSGFDLYKQYQKNYPSRPVYYEEEPLDALPLVKKILKPGDLFVTLGAGNNFNLSHKLYKELYTSS